MRSETSCPLSLRTLHFFVVYCIKKYFYWLPPSAVSVFCSKMSSQTFFSVWLIQMFFKIVPLSRQTTNAVCTYSFQKVWQQWEKARPGWVHWAADAILKDVPDLFINYVAPVRVFLVWWGCRGWNTTVISLSRADIFFFLPRSRNGRLSGIMHLLKVRVDWFLDCTFCVSVMRLWPPCCERY